MEQNNIVYSNLLELSSSNYKITDGEADIIGWQVNTEAGSELGKVKDLLFDQQQNAVRYLVIEISNIGADLGGKTVIIPIGIANLAEDGDAIILPDLHLDQLQELPTYAKGAITHAHEDLIRLVIGSPAALRLEETIIELDRAQFYQHHHFDKTGFFNRDRMQGTDKTNTEIELQEERLEEQTAIHNLIEKSQNDLE